MNNPRILLAAPASGSGKTMITCGILQALHDRGMKVSSFKCGPDYIDPMFHEKVIHVRSGNLDPFFCDEEMLVRLFKRNAEGTDISVIEGVMGYYDGLAAESDRASSYHVAKSLRSPVILIVNARGQSLSALATLKGFLEFRQDSRIKGVIFNQMQERIFQSLKPEVEKLGITPIGYVPKAEEMVIESRHLGLVTPGEIEDLSERLKKLADMLEKTLDMDALIRMAKFAGELPKTPETKLPEGRDVRVAVAKDEAFCFFYKDNLYLLEKLGAKLTYFSPIHDKTLPEGVQGLLLPGGYPELYAQQLSENVSMRTSIAEAVKAGLPTLAECGGFMYLHEEMEDMEGKSWPMCGIIPAKSWRTNRLGRFGYINLTAKTSTGILRKNDQIRGHEFHYFESGSCGEACRADKPSGTRSWDCIHAEDNLVAGFPHLFYEANPEIAARFLRRCAEWTEDGSKNPAGEEER